MRAQEKQDKADEDGRVEQGQREHERRRELATRDDRLHSERRQHRDEDQLCGKPGAQDDFERRGCSFNGQDRSLKGTAGELRRTFDGVVGHSPNLTRLTARGL